jgi:Zn-dependent protease with chaperone function
MNRLAALAGAILVAVVPLFAHAEVHYYLVDSVAQQSTNADLRAEAHELETIYADMERVSGVDAKLVWSTNPDINAFATEIGSDKIVIVQEGLLETMHGDRDAVAAVLGHELGHHKADHIRAGKRKRETAHVLGTILGAVVGAKIGHGGGAAAGAVLGNAGGGLVALKFNRDQEMEADKLSVGWMIAAGYNPQGMLRLQRQLGELEGKHRSAAIFSTHPNSEKRYKAAEQQIAKLAPPPELLAHAAEPLVSDKALIAARAAIWSAADERIAQALKPGAGDVAADALAPVDKVGFDSYAALQNQLQFAGAKGESHLLAKNHLTEAQLTRISATFAMRMNDNPALNQHYFIAYWRASQGKFAGHGRDLADSYEHAQALKLEPPYPLETAALLHVRLGRLAHLGGMPLDVEQEAIANAAQTTILKPYGLTYYDFVIGDNWWMRKAALALLDGDDNVLRKFEGIGASSDATADDEDGDDAQAEAAANVHVGNNVQVGKGVHVGGHEAKPRETANKDNSD